MPVLFLTLLVATGIAWLANAPPPPGHRRRPDTARGRVALLAGVTGAILAAVAALRWRVGVDYWTYEQIYHRTRQVQLSDWGLLDEPGFAAIIHLSRWLHDDSATMFAIAAVVTVTLFVATIWRQSPLFALSIALFVLTATWQGSFNGVRQYLAASIIFAAHHYIIERRLLRYALAVFLASLFHVSALAMLAYYLVPRERLTPGRVLLLMAGAVIVLQSQYWLLDEIGRFRGIEAWGSQYALNPVHPLRIAVSFVPLLLYGLLIEKSRLDARGFFYANTLFVNAATWLAVAGSAYLARFAIYSSMFVIIAIPALLVTMRKENRIIVTFALLALYGVFWFLNTAKDPTLFRFNWIFDRP